MKVDVSKNRGPVRIGLIVAAAALVWGFVSAVEPPESGEKQKTVFCISMHCFPYNRDYSDHIEASDRPLDWDPRLTDEEAARLKMQRMQEAGIDVCAQTLFYAQGKPPVGGDTTLALSIFKRSLDACEGTSVRVAPEICAISRSNEHGLEDAAAFFRKMIETCGDHPRWFHYKGKLVVFMWHPIDDENGAPVKFGPSKLEEIWTLLGPELRSKLYVINECYYMVTRSDEYVEQNWNKNNYIDRLLSVTENLFWWYSWPDPASERFRAGLLAKTLREKTDEPIIAGIRPGYYRKNIGVINPHQVTAKFRALWDANLEMNPDWIYFYSWDDYGENGQIEPTRLNRGAYSALVRTMTSAWKGSDAALPPETWAGLPRSVMRGQIFQAEVLQLNTAAAYSKVTLALEDPDGHEVYRSAATTAQDGYGQVKIFPFSVPTVQPNFNGLRALVPVIYTDGADGSRTHRGLSPIRLTRHHPMNPMYQFCRMDQLRAPTEIDFTYETSAETVASQKVAGQFAIDSGAVPLRRAELRDLNGFAIPFSSEPAVGSQQFGGLPEDLKPSSDVRWFDRLAEDRTIPFYLPLEPPVSQLARSFSFDTQETHDASGMSYLFLEYTDGTTWAGAPCLMKRSGTLVKTTVFDLSDPDIWRPAGTEMIPEEEAVIGRWVFSDYDAEARYEGAAYIPDRGLYGFPLYLGGGPNKRLYKDREEKHPEFDAAAGVFSFDGAAQVLRLPDFVFPPGAFSMEFEIFPEGSDGKEQWLLWNKRSVANVKRSPDGHIIVSRGFTENQIFIESQSVVQDGEWSQIRVGDDGHRLFIYINGRLDAVGAHDPLYLKSPLSAWSDLILIGGSTTDGFFRGQMRSVSICNSVPDLDHVPEKSLPADFLDEFNRGLDRTVWNISTPPQTSVGVIDGRLVFEDKSVRWGEGASIETVSRYIATGQAFRVSAQFLAAETGIQQGTSLAVGFPKNVSLRYWFNSERMQLALNIGGDTIWKSGLWLHGNLIRTGEYAGLEVSPDGWRLVHSTDGTDWATLIVAGTPAEGKLPEPDCLQFSEPLTVQITNAKAGSAGSEISLDNLQISGL